MSTSRWRCSNAGTACNAPRRMSRASSAPEMTDDVDAGLVARARDELVAVLRLPHGARRDGVELGAVAVDEPPEPARAPRCLARWRRA